MGASPHPTLPLRGRNVEGGPYQETVLYTIYRIITTDEKEFLQFLQKTVIISPGGVGMRFKLIIDKNKAEEVVVTAHARTDLVDELEALVMHHGGTDPIPVYTEDTLKMLPVSQIECITVLEGKTWAVASDGKRYRLKQRLYEMEAILPPSFIRINKSALANEARLDRFAVTYSGGVDAVFQSGYTEYVSRRCFAQIKRRLSGK